MQSIFTVERKNGRYNRIKREEKENDDQAFAFGGHAE